VTRVKICGITRAEDAIAAAGLGASYLGFIFVKESPRCVTPEQALGLRHAASSSAGPEFVGVFRNESHQRIRDIADFVGLDLIQLHGDEGYRLDLPTIQAFHVKDTLPDAETAADYVMFDSGGGTGRTFDWALLDRYPRTKPFFLAGGITPDNVAEAVERTRPFAVDVASGVESSPGVKDHQKLRALFERIQR
jgi:phosphoribosylanthranilate isomerase